MCSPFSLDRCLILAFLESKTVHSPAFNSVTWFNILLPGCFQCWIESKGYNRKHISLHWTIVIASKIYLKVVVVFSCSDVSDSLWPHGLQRARLPCPSLSLRVCSNSHPLGWWCHPTIPSSAAPSPPALSLSQHQGLFQWVGSLIQMAKVLELQLEHQSFQWIFKVDFL